MAMCCSIPTSCYSFAVGNGTSMFFRYESPCPDVSIYYWPKKLSCPCSTVPRRPVLLRLQGVTWGPVPRPQETCCKGLTAALFIRGIRAVLLAITFWVFFRHALLVAASEQVSGAAPWGQQGFSHLCLLQTSQQLPPGSPRGNHHCVRAHPASRQCQCPHGMQPAAELQLLLSFQGEQGSRALVHQVMNKMGCKHLLYLVRRRLEVRLQHATWGTGADLCPGNA